MRDINKIIIHCADTPNGLKRYTARDIDEWHHADGYHHSLRYDPVRVPDAHPVLVHIGYHRVIEVDGTVVNGTSVQEDGDHAKRGGGNRGSIGICLIGRDAFTEDAWMALRGLILQLQAEFKLDLGQVYPHSFFDSARTCPGFNVDRWLHGGMMPLEGHVCEVR